MMQLRVPGRMFTIAQVVAVVAAVNLFVVDTPMRAHAAGTPDPIRIVAFGDSLTAGYMLKPNDAFPAQLARALTDAGYTVEIANAGVSGDTTGAGLQRFDWSVPEGTEAVILELGANDALRGIAPDLVRKTLEALIAKLKARNIEVLLAGMSSPENWGKDYADEFNAIYTDLAQKNGLILYPFFLEGVALKPDLNLADGLHPTPEGVAVIVKRILPSVEQLIARVKSRRTELSKD
jgi:acyl-CoA thioesterase-1